MDAISPKMSVGIIPTAQVGQYWLHAAPWLAPAIKRSGGRYTPETTLAALEKGQMQLWLGHINGEILAAATTQVVEYPAITALVVVHCGGRDMDRWLKDGIWAIESWGKHHGCKLIELVGRPGWSAALGYVKGGCISERRL